jgi:hypothetical protein
VQNTILRRTAILAVAGVLGIGPGSALAWNGNGEHNGWDNKQERGCPESYESTPVAEAADPVIAALVDLNGDGTVCTKTTPPTGDEQNYVDNISNH